MRFKVVDLSAADRVIAVGKILDEVKKTQSDATRPSAKMRAEATEVVLWRAAAAHASAAAKDADARLRKTLEQRHSIEVDA